MDAPSQVERDVTHLGRGVVVLPDQVCRVALASKVHLGAPPFRLHVVRGEDVGAVEELVALRGDRAVCPKLHLSRSVCKQNERFAKALHQPNVRDAGALHRVIDWVRVDYEARAVDPEIENVTGASGHDTLPGAEPQPALVEHHVIDRVADKRRARIGRTVPCSAGLPVDQLQDELGPVEVKP